MNTIVTDQRTRSLVTGGAGFIGSHVAEERLKRGDDVIVLDDLSGGFAENVPHGAKLVQGSILDVELLEKLFQEYSFDYVFHLGAYAAEGLSHFIRRYNYSTNLVGSMNLINASVNYHVKRFIFTSSIAVYGPGQVPMSEDMDPIPEDPYGISKYAVELDLKAAKHLFDLDYVVFRPHNVYGERQNISDRYRNVIGIFMNQLMQDQPMTIWGDGSQTRAFTYIADVAPLIAESAEIPEVGGQVFNIGADTPYTVNYLVEVVAAAMGKQANKIHHPARKEVVDAFSSHEKIRQFFGERPQVGLEEGIARMARWALSAGPRPGVKFENIEIEKNLPASWKNK